MTTPTAQQLGDVAEALSGWQHDNGPLHLHPGDLGWNSTRGADGTAAALRLWWRDGRLAALGLLDDPDLLRMALDPDLRDDDEVARAIVANVDDPAAGVFEPGDANVEARGARRVSELLSAGGWHAGDPWTPFRLDLSDPIADAGVRVETITSDHAADWCEVHWSAFRGTPFSDHDRHDYTGRWLTMMSGPFASRVQSLGTLNREGQMVAVAGVWSAGVGRPGLIEPMGVHSDQQGHGYGRAITLAAAATLREMGASSAIVCAENSNSGALATYAAAGFTADESVADLSRSA